MCGRYQFTQQENQDIAEIIREVNEKHNGTVKLGEIRPTNLAPVLIGGQEGVHADALVWGFPNFRNKGVIMNARSETVLEKPLFRTSFLERRCVIPTTGFFEWDTDKTKHLFQLPGQAITYLSGFYNDFKGERRYVILTTKANPSVSDIHDRMPVILQKDQLHRWITDPDQATAHIHAAMPSLTSITAQ